jgi:Cdc6-like AAA superfamily ATPase
MKNRNNKTNEKTNKRKSIDLSDNMTKDGSNNHVFVNIVDLSNQKLHFFPLFDESNNEIDVFPNYRYDISLIKRNFDIHLSDFDKKIKEIIEDLLNDIDIKDNYCLENSVKKEKNMGNDNDNPLQLTRLNHTNTIVNKKNSDNNDSSNNDINYFLSLMKLLDNDSSNNGLLNLTLTHSYDKNKLHLDKLLDSFDKDYTSFQASNTLYTDTTPKSNKTSNGKKDRKLLDNKPSYDRYKTTYGSSYNYPDKPYNSFDSLSNNKTGLNSKPYTYGSHMRKKRRSSLYTNTTRQHGPRPPTPPRPSLKIQKKKVTIDVEINGLSDLLDLIKKYPLSYEIEYNINMDAIHNIEAPLLELDKMIGMKKLKDSVVDQILYFIQDLHTIAKVGSANEDFMHTVIYGPPGTGKTEIAKIMGKIFSKMGILKKGTFRKATRADLIAGYLGQTALKTKEVIKESLGGVLFIDEAYALGNSEKRDSFAKECIDTLCEALSDNKDKLMVIIAGYEKDLKDCFFNYNQGLESRFTWRFKTDDYTHKELKDIFIKKVKDAGWSFKKEDKIKDTWFEENMDYFKYYGRDMETLFSKTKIAHARRVFCKPKDEKTKLSMKDLKKGLELYLQNDEVKSRKENDNGIKDIIASMYV